MCQALEIKNMAPALEKLVVWGWVGGRQRHEETISVNKISFELARKLLHVFLLHLMEKSE